MKVRVKEGMKGFIYDMLFTSLKEITLKNVTCVNKKDGRGKPLVITPENQFSDNWMERIEEPKRPGRPKKEKEDEPV